MNRNLVEFDNPAHNVSVCLFSLIQQQFTVPEIVIHVNNKCVYLFPSSCLEQGALCVYGRSQQVHSRFNE
jgi:hypothetical protein